MRMQRTKTVVVPAKPETTKEVVIYGCDFCDREHTEAGRFTRCCVCQRVVCRGFIDSCYRNDPFETGDYPDHYCPVCYALRFGTHEKEYLAEEARYEHELELLDELVKNESLGTKITRIRRKEVHVG